MTVDFVILNEIESAAVRASDAVFKKINMFGLTDRSGKKVAIAPSIHAVCLSGKTEKMSMGSYRTTVHLFMTAISTHPLREDDRRNELYPVVMAIIMMFTGMKLTYEDGSELPCSKLEPHGSWGQSNEEGDELAYTVPFSLTIDWKPVEDANLPDLSIKMGFYVQPDDELVAESVLDLQG